MSNRLREIAEAATPGPWGVLAPEFEGEPGWVLGPPEGNFRPAILEGKDEVEAVEFAATFDPPTVLAMLSVIEAAEDFLVGMTPQGEGSPLRQALAHLREVASRG